MLLTSAVYHQRNDFSNHFLLFVQLMLSKQGISHCIKIIVLPDPVLPLIKNNSLLSILEKSISSFKRGRNYSTLNVMVSFINPPFSIRFLKYFLSF